MLVSDSVIAKRTDANQKKIVNALRKAGAWVYVVGKPFDLLVAFKGELNLMEVKTDEGQLNKTQVGLLIDCRRAGYMPHIVRTVNEAMEEVIDGKSL